MRELKERLRKAQKTLIELAKITTEAERVRIHGKIEGVTLAISYVNEAIKEELKP